MSAACGGGIGASVEIPPRPTPPSTLPELIANLSKGDDMERLVAAGALSAMGANAACAVPALIWDLVRRALEETLGKPIPPTRPGQK